jgi:hypothetical protein
MIPAENLKIRLARRPQVPDPDNIGKPDSTHTRHGSNMEDRRSAHLVEKFCYLKVSEIFEPPGRVYYCGHEMA